MSSSLSKAFWAEKVQNIIPCPDQYKFHKFVHNTMDLCTSRVKILKINWSLDEIIPVAAAM